MTELTTELTTCGDCAVPPGQPHEDGCDVARCTECGLQRISCDHGNSDLGWRQVWTGRWPGEAECEEFGWWSRWTVVTQYSRDGLPDSGMSVRCDADHPHAHHDLTRLRIDAIWDRDAQRYVLPGA